MRVLRETIGLSVSMIILSISLHGSCMAQGPPPAKSADEDLYVSELGADFVVPESPGLTILGLDPTTASHPKSPRELAASALNAVDRDGNLQTGVAVDTAPYLLFFGRGVTRGTYTHDPLTRQLSRLQVSFATTKGTDDEDKAIRAGFGVRWTPIDLGDPRTDQELADCLFERLTKRDEAYAARTRNNLQCNPDLPPGTPCLTLEQAQKANAEAIKAVDADAALNYSATVEACRKQSGRRLWNRSAVTLGGAPAWISTDGTVDELRSSGGAFWTVAAYGFDQFDDEYEKKLVPGGASEWLYHHAEAVVHFSYLADTRVPKVEDDDPTRRDTLSAGALFRIGTRWGALGIDASFSRDDPNEGPTDTFYSITAKGDLRLTGDLWLSLSVGGQGGRSKGEEQAFVMSGLKWAFPETPTYGKPL